MEDEIESDNTRKIYINQKVNNLQRKPYIRIPTTLEVKDLEEKVRLMVNEAYRELDNIANMARQSNEEYLKLRETPAPFFWEFNKWEYMNTRYRKAYTLAKNVTEALKGVGILEKDVEVLAPSYALGLIANYKPKVLEKSLEIHQRMLNKYVEYNIKILKDLARVTGYRPSDDSLNTPSLQEIEYEHIKKTDTLNTSSLQEILGYEHIKKTDHFLFEVPTVQPRGYGIIIPALSTALAIEFYFVFPSWVELFSKLFSD